MNRKPPAKEDEPPLRSSIKRVFTAEVGFDVPMPFEDVHDFEAS